MPKDYIEQIQGDFGIRRIIAGTRVQVHDVAAAYVFGDSSPEWIAENFGISLAQVFAALAFYFDNKELIDREIAEDDAYARRVAVNAREHFEKLTSKQ